MTRIVQYAAILYAIVIAFRQTGTAFLQAAAACYDSDVCWPASNLRLRNNPTESAQILRTKRLRPHDREALLFVLSCNKQWRAKATRRLVSVALRGGPEDKSSMVSAVSRIYLHTHSHVALSALMTLNLDGGPGDTLSEQRQQLISVSPEDVGTFLRNRHHSVSRACLRERGVFLDPFVNDIASMLGDPYDGAERRKALHLLHTKAGEGCRFLEDVILLATKRWY